jgi:hypothetical protein
MCNVVLLTRESNAYHTHIHTHTHKRHKRNPDLLELNAWSSKWLMSFNPEKTEILFFSNTGK